MSKICLVETQYNINGWEIVDISALPKEETITADEVVRETEMIKPIYNSLKTATHTVIRQEETSKSSKYDQDVSSKDDTKRGNLQIRHHRGGKMALKGLHVKSEKQEDLETLLSQVSKEYEGSVFGERRKIELNRLDEINSGVTEIENRILNPMETKE